MRKHRQSQQEIVTLDIIAPKDPQQHKKTLVLLEPTQLQQQTELWLSASFARLENIAQDQLLQLKKIAQLILSATTQASQPTLNAHPAQQVTSAQQLQREFQLLVQLELTQRPVIQLAQIAPQETTAQPKLQLTRRWLQILALTDSNVQLPIW